MLWVAFARCGSQLQCYPPPTSHIVVERFREKFIADLIAGYVGMGIFFKVRQVIYHSTRLYFVAYFMYQAFCWILRK